MSVLRNLHLRTNFESASLKTATFEGRDFLVVPVIALMEGVVWPGNADFPEFVPAATLSKSPARWNTKPVMMNHPFKDGIALMAGQPKVLEESRIGLIFNTRMKKKQLHMDAWLDIAKCESMGGEALSTLERVRNFQEVEVSVGAWVDLDDTEGEFEGDEFRGAWQEIGPDHLAFLEEGTPGACSVEMGCGAPRVAHHRILSSGIKIIPSSTEEGVVIETEKNSWTSRLLKMLKGTMPDDRMAVLIKASEMTDNDLRNAVSQELQATIPGYIGIIALKLAESVAVFDTWVNNNWQYKQQQYSLAEDGTVKLIGKAVDVEIVTDFKPMSSDVPATTEPPITAFAPCGCQDKEPLTMKTKDERISALIASQKNTFADAHKAFLATLSEDQLKQLEDADATIAEPKAEEPKPEAAVVAKPEAVAAVAEPKPEPTVASAKPITVADLPAELKDLVDNAKAHDATVRAGAIKALAESKQTVYSEADLKAMSTKDLVRVATLASKPGATAVVDFSMQNLQGVAPVEESDVVAAPKSLAALFAKK